MIDVAFTKEIQDWITNTLSTENEALVCMDEVGQTGLGELVLWCAGKGIKVTVPNENEFVFKGNKIFNLRRNLMVLS